MADRPRPSLLDPPLNLHLVRRARWRLAIRASVLVMTVLGILSAGVWLAGRQALFGRLYERLERASGQTQDAGASDQTLILHPLTSSSSSPYAFDPDRDGDRDFAITSDTQYGVIAVLRGQDTDGQPAVLATPASDEVAALGIFAALLGALTLAGGLVALPAAYLLAGHALRPLAEAIQERSEFVALASHRLRTPLSVIRTSAELALAGQAVAPEEALRTILTQGQEMEALAGRLTALARTETRNPTDPQRPTDLTEVARRVSDALGPAALGSGVNIRLEGAGPTLAAGPDGDITDALTSVLENAVHFSPRGSSVTVRTSEAGRWAVLEVADQGPGIDPAELPRITEPFFQGSLGRSHGGTGLGLAIASATLTRLGGRLQITSDLGTGTTVRLLLPRKRPGKTQ